MADAQRFDVPDSWGLQDKVAIVTGGGAAGSRTRSWLPPCWPCS